MDQFFRATFHPVAILLVLVVLMAKCLFGYKRANRNHWHNGVVVIPYINSPTYKDSKLFDSYFVNESSWTGILEKLHLFVVDLRTRLLSNEHLDQVVLCGVIFVHM